MEIERKWMVNGWPKTDLPLLFEQSMRQGYFSVRPTVRIREEATVGGKTDYIVCFKSGKGIVRKETEFPVSEAIFRELEGMLEYPLIPKIRRTYLLPDGYHLEVNHVDEGLPSEFWYAEIEYPTEKAARAFDPAADGLADYLSDDVSEQPGQTMGEYWIKTRLTKG